MAYDWDRRFGQLLNYGDREVPVGEVVQFVPRNSATKKREDPPKSHDDLTGESVIEYESSLGFAPVYVAPESDPA